jgi:hypothetical protein
MSEALPQPHTRGAGPTTTSGAAPTRSRRWLICSSGDMTPSALHDATLTRRRSSRVRSMAASRAGGGRSPSRLVTRRSSRSQLGIRRARGDCVSPRVVRSSWSRHNAGRLARCKRVEATESSQPLSLYSFVQFQTDHSLGSTDGCGVVVGTAGQEYRVRVIGELTQIVARRDELVPLGEKQPIGSTPPSSSARSGASTPARPGRGRLLPVLAAVSACDNLDEVESLVGL